MACFIRSRTLAVVLLYVGIGSLCCCQTPAWYNQPQFFKNFDEYQTTDPLIFKVPFTGLGWGLLPNYPALSQFNAEGYSPIPANVQQEAAQVSAWNFGGPYFASSNLKRLYDSPPPSWDQFRM